MNVAVVIWHCRACYYTVNSSQVHVLSVAIKTHSLLYTTVIGTSVSATGIAVMVQGAGAVVIDLSYLCMGRNRKKMGQ